MTSPHRCDHSTNPADAPLTRARVRRVLAATLQNDTAAIERVLIDLGGCSHCLTMVTLMMAGAAAQNLPHQEMSSLMALDLELDANLEDPERR